MAYLLRSSDRFIIVETRPRQGLFYHAYTKDGFLKPSLIHPFPSERYTATLDEQGSLHVVTESSKNQIFYVHFVKGSATKRVVLEDPHHYYMFKHLSLHPLDHHLYLLYSVKHPSGSGRSLMYQSLDATPSDVTTLLQSIPDFTTIKVVATPSKLYILYTDFDTNYQLKLLTLTTDSLEHATLYTSPLPIIDFNACLLQDTIHLSILKDAYGNQQALYLNTQTHTEHTLEGNNHPVAPSLFSSTDSIWLTYTQHQKLYMQLSMDHGRHFSIAVPSSLEGYYTPYYYATQAHENLSATMLYATSSSTFRLGVLSAIDLKGIHPDLHPSSELELLLEGMRYASRESHGHLSQKTVATPIQNIPSPLPVPTAIPLPTPQPIEHYNTAPVPTTKDIHSATKAFMGAHTLFDARPMQ